MGKGFYLIPNNIVGIMGLSNDEPLSLKDTTILAYVCNVIEKTDNKIVFAVDSVHQYSVRGYLGGIVSDDRQTVYWVNNTKPLP